ncbi:uncharacterized protein BDV17DRAFT_257081 [Aspergillus undulatus]|uniref:uncharacterized protein n=1 Tax=Aspergillus undulatus TaxID=1810928 RepID=UPI003CCDFF0F
MSPASSYDEETTVPKQRMPLGLDVWTLILGLIFVLAPAGLDYACELVRIFIQTR